MTLGGLAGLTQASSDANPALGGPWGLGAEPKVPSHSPPRLCTLPGRPHTSPSCPAPLLGQVDTALVQVTGRLRPHYVHTRPARWHRPAPLKPCRAAKTLSVVPGFQPRTVQQQLWAMPTPSWGALSWTVLWGECAGGEAAFPGVG